MGRGDPDESLFAIRVEIRDSGSGERHDCGGPHGLPDGGQKRGGESPSARSESTRARSRSGRDHRSDRPVRGLHKGRIGSGAEPRSPSPHANPYASVWTWKSACDKVQSGEARGPPFRSPSDSTLGQKESSRCLFPCGLAHPAHVNPPSLLGRLLSSLHSYVRHRNFLGHNQKQSHLFGGNTISGINAGEPH